MIKKVTDKELDDLIEVTKASARSFLGNDPYSEAVLKCLLELKERQDSDLRPADKFLTNTPDEQFAHVCSEYHEFWNEWVDWVAHRNRYPEKAKIYIQRMVEEGIDLQMSIETLLARFGLDEQQRRKERKKVLAKNAARGYYVIGG